MYSHSTVKALVEQSAVEQRKMDGESNYIRGSHFKFVENMFSLSPLVFLVDHVVDDCPQNIYRTEPRLNWNKSSFSVDWGRFSMSDLVFKKSWSLVCPSGIWCKSNQFFFGHDKLLLFVYLFSANTIWHVWFCIILLCFTELYHVMYTVHCIRC